VVYSPPPRPPKINSPPVQSPPPAPVEKKETPPAHAPAPSDDEFIIPPFIGHQYASPPPPMFAGY